MSAWARPGVKVVCVDANAGRQSGRPVPFSKGDVLTIQSISHGGSLRFVEVPHFRADIGCFVSYDPSRFRPVAPTTRTQEQDVAMFRHLLAPVKEGV